MSEDGNSIFKKGQGEALKIAVVGCGGMGCNTLRSIDLPDDVKSIALGADRREIAGTRADAEVVIGHKDALASATSKDSKYASNDTEMEISYLLKGCDIVFPIAGLGGDTGGWLASLVGRAAKLSKASSLALITTPFNAEGRGKRQLSTKQLEALRKWSGAVIFKNDQILKEVPNLPMEKAFRVMNRVVAAPIKEFHGQDRASLKDIRKFLKTSHVFRMDAAQWRSDNPELAIVDEFMKSEWLSLDVLEPKCAVFFVKGFGVNEALARDLSGNFGEKVGADIPACLFLEESTEGRETKVTALVGL